MKKFTAQILQNKMMFIAFILNAVLIFGCNPTMVVIPDANHDQYPVITVHSLPSGPGRVSPGEVSVATSKPVGVTEKTTVLITVDAANAGGVKNLHIVGYKGGNKMWEAAINTVPNAQNMGPRTLSIIGHNGTGGIGSQPLMFIFDKLFETAYVKVDATNFNNQTTNLQVNYEVLQSELVP